MLQGYRQDQQDLRPLAVLRVLADQVRLYPLAARKVLEVQCLLVNHSDPRSPDLPDLPEVLYLQQDLQVRGDRPLQRVLEDQGYPWRPSLPGALQALWPPAAPGHRSDQEFPADLEARLVQ